MRGREIVALVPYLYLQGHYQKNQSKVITIVKDCNKVIKQDNILSMRLQITLQHKPNQVLPINYQYLVSSWIYRTLGNANSEFATKLHEQGYNFGGKQYKLFTFSALQPNWYRIDKQAKTFILVKSPTVIEFSFFIEDALQHFVVGLFKNQSFTLSSGTVFRVDFEVSSIEIVPKPIFQPTQKFQLITPLCISQDQAGERYAQYLSPEHADYATLLIQNLLRKQQALQPVPASEIEQPLPMPLYSFRLLSQPKRSPRTVKHIKVIGYVFDFELSAPVELLELGYYAGFGEKNSALGMGMVEKLV